MRTKHDKVNKQPLPNFGGVRIPFPVDSLKCFRKFIMKIFDSVLMLI